ncbi:MAG: pectate lyase, partial [Firmicutes bacterium]|nr:pectate lyase [Bacillota bacterium]
MKSKAKKLIGGLLAATMLFSSAPAPAGVQSFSVLTEAASGISMYDATGWYESAYVKWSPVSGAALYKAYIKGASGSYTQLDDPL